MMDSSPNLHSVPMEILHQIAAELHAESNAYRSTTTTTSTTSSPTNSITYDPKLAQSALVSFSSLGRDYYAAAQPFIWRKVSFLTYDAPSRGNNRKRATARAGKLFDILEGKGERREKLGNAVGRLRPKDRVRDLEVGIIGWTFANEENILIHRLAKLLSHDSGSSAPSSKLPNLINFRLTCSLNPISPVIHVLNPFLVTNLLAHPRIENLHLAAVDLPASKTAALPNLKKVTLEHCGLEARRRLVHLSRPEGSSGELREVRILGKSKDDKSRRWEDIPTPEVWESLTHFEMENAGEADLVGICNSLKQANRQTPLKVFSLSLASDFPSFAKSSRLASPENLLSLISALRSLDPIELQTLHLHLPSIAFLYRQLDRAFSATAGSDGYHYEASLSSTTLLRSISRAFPSLKELVLTWETSRPIHVAEENLIRQGIEDLSRLSGLQTITLSPSSSPAVALQNQNHQTPPVSPVTAATRFNTPQLNSPISTSHALDSGETDADEEHLKGEADFIGRALPRVDVVKFALEDGGVLKYPITRSIKFDNETGAMDETVEVGEAERDIRC